MPKGKKRRLDLMSRDAVTHMIELACSVNCIECPMFQRCMGDPEFFDQSCPETIAAYLFEEVDDAQT